MDYNYIDFLICNKIIFHRLSDTGQAHGTRTRQIHRQIAEIDILISFKYVNILNENT